MARTSDTAERTLTAAWALLAEGVYPSAQAIREQIRQGSMTTINQALKHDFWPAVARRLQRPEVPTPVLDGAQALWQTALEAADEALARYRHEVDERLAAAEAERQAALDQQQALQQTLAAREADLAQQRERNSDLGQRLEAERERAQALQQQVTETTQALNTAELTARQTEERLSAALATEKRRHDDTEQRLTRLYDDQKTARERLEQQLRRQVAAGEKAVAVLHKEIQALQRANADAVDNAAVLTAAVADKDAQWQAESVRAAQHDAERARLAQTLAQREADLAEHARVQEALCEARDAARVAQAAAEREAQVLTQQLQALTATLSPHPDGTAPASPPTP